MAMVEVAIEIMSERLKVVGPDQFVALADFIHDCRFDWELAEFDSQTHILNIPFRRETWEKREIVSRFLLIKKCRVPFLKYLMRIFHVENFQVHKPDPSWAGPGDYFITFHYEEEEGRILFETVYSEGVEIRFHDLEISIVETTEVMETRTRYVIFDPPIWIFTP